MKLARVDPFLACLGSYDNYPFASCGGPEFTVGQSLGSSAKPQALVLVQERVSSAKKTLRALSGASGSRRNPLKSIFVVQTSQNGLGQNSMIARNPVSGESLHCAACRRFWYPWPQAGVWAASVVMSHPLLENCPQMPLVQRNQEIQTLAADRSD